EDSDLCLRARARGHRILYAGDAIIDHHIAAARLTYRWVARRLYYAGINRATLGGAPSANHGLGRWDGLFLPAIAVPCGAGFVHAWMQGAKRRDTRRTS